MLGVDFNYQFIDWQHDPTPDEEFHHLGTLTALVSSPNITVGLNDWWNFSIIQMLGNRYMTWGADTTSKHHRDEGSESNFTNAIGGYLGDTKVMVRYLLFNAGRGPGVRLFLGGGMAIPSENTLTSDPFFLNGTSIEEHRHFSMSEGVYKAIFETQFFIKRMKNPVFMGGTLTIEEPLKENEYGFQASRLIDLSFTAFTRKLKPINGSLGGSLMIRNTSEAFWNGISAPNSKSTLIIPGFGALWSLDFATLSVNFQYPIFIDGAFSGGDGDSNEETNTLQISIGMRRVLDFYIPWLYW